MDPRFTRLKTWLQQADLQKKNFPLYQILSGLIDFLNKEQSITNTEIGDTGSSISSLTNSDILTFSDESAFLPQSRELVAGDNILFDDTTPNERSINAVKDETYITENDETSSLANSRRIIAGTNVIFDNSVAGQLTINVAASADHVVLSDGGVPALPIDDGFGNFIYIPYTP